MSDTTFTRAAQRPGEKSSTHPVGPDPFAQPEWAATHMDKGAKFDEREEHRMLLLFYSCWKALHEAPKAEKETAAQALVTVSKQIDEYRKTHQAR
jgi:hypothetical protein